MRHIFKKSGKTGKGIDCERDVKGCSVRSGGQSKGQEWYTQGFPVKKKGRKQRGKVTLLCVSLCPALVGLKNLCIFWISHVFSPFLTENRGHSSIESVFASSVQFERPVPGFGPREERRERG